MKKIALICSIIASVTVFAGCGAKEESKVDNTSKTPVVESNAETDNSTTNNDDTSNKEEGTESEGEMDSKEPVSNKENQTSNSKDEKKEEAKAEEAILYYYDAEADKMKSETIKAEIIDENLILEKLKSKKMLTSDVKINKIDKKDKVAIIDFNSAFINRNLGSGVEGSVLQAVTQTFISGLKLEKLKITVDGKNYESGHIILEDNHYFEKE